MGGSASGSLLDVLVSSLLFCHFDISLPSSTSPSEELRRVGVQHKQFCVCV